MNAYKDDPTFTVMGQKITLISDDGCYGPNTVADMGDYFYYMGNEYPTISTAIFAWQENNRELTSQELRQVMIDNGVIEGEKHASQEESQKDCQEITEEDIIQEDNSQEDRKEDN
jgi:hypothetical protein